MRSFLPGKRLPEKVVDQIEKRQEVLGLTGDRFSETGPSSYAYYSQKTPWIRVVSSVRIKDNDTPARINILSNGVLENHNSNTPAGYEISPTLGPRPKPGITSMDLRTHNRFGSLRTATVNFTVFSIEDLNIYERLYMSPGYTALLEWGHSKALTSDGEVEDVQPLDLEEVFQEGLTMSRIFAKIQEHRRKYSYNYDASFGLVKNFSWSLSSDGSYECSMDIVSIGTAFESMNISAGILPRDVLEFLKENPPSEEEAEIVTQEQEDGWINLFGAFNQDRVILTGKSPAEILDQTTIAENYRKLISPELEVGIADNNEDLVLRQGRLSIWGTRELFKSNLNKDTGEVEATRVRNVLEESPRRDVIIAASPTDLSFVIARSYRKRRLAYIFDARRVPQGSTQKVFSRLPGTVNPPEDLEGLIPDYLKDGNRDGKTIALTDGRVAKLNLPSEEDIIRLGVTSEPYTESARVDYSIFLIPISVTVEQAEEETAADIQQQEENQANLDQILNKIRDYHPELRSRIHFFIDQLSKEARDNAAEFAESSANPDNFYKEFTSSYLLEKLRNYIYPESPEGRARLTLYSTTALKYITVDQTGTSEAEELHPVRSLLRNIKLLYSKRSK